MSATFETPPDAGAATPAGPSPWARVVVFQRRFQVFQLLALGLLFLWGATTVTDFTASISLKAMLVSAAFLGLAGAGQTLVVLVGGIDFAVPAFISGGAIFISQLCGTYHWNVVVAIALILALALLLGGFNGYVSHRFEVPSLVVTLGMSSMITGGLLIWTKGAATGAAPPFLARLTAVGGTTFGIGLPPLVVLWAVVAVILGVVLRRTVAGRRVYQTGANPVAAEFSLIRTRWVWTLTFAASGLLAGILGILVGGYTGSGNTTLGDPYLFEGLAAVIVGGTTFGARGDYWRTVLGALVLTVLTTVLVGNGYSNADQQMIFGFLILLVVAGYGRSPRLRDRI
jgi:ribose transport system permease protein